MVRGFETRRGFIGEFAALAACAAVSPFAGCATSSSRPRVAPPARRDPESESRLVSEWDAASEAVSRDVYLRYLKDGDTRGFAILENAERAFDKVMREAVSLRVDGDVPVVWCVYNMGFVVKTRHSLFSIDLVHRRDAEFAPLLDFALVTHNHGDHWRKGFVGAMSAAGKPVVSNFLRDPRFESIKKRNGCTAKGVGAFKLGDAEIRTSLIDHGDAPWAIDFTMAFEIKIGGFILYHTGDSGRGTVPKLHVTVGRPDLWLFFPGCGIDTPAAVGKINPKRIVFGHLWELGHAAGRRGRLDEPLVRRRLAEARPLCADTSLAFWGDRIC